MKKLAFVILLLIFFQQTTIADVSVYSSDKKFGLQDSNGNIITEAKYKKLVRLGTTSWIVQNGTRFGILDDSGKIIVKPIYNQAERLLGKYVKFRKGNKYCLLDERGNDIIGKNLNDNIKYYSSIDLLYGGLIITSINHKYGLHSFNGKTHLDNIFDDIFMHDKDTLVVVYGGQQFDFKRSENLDYPYCFEFKDLSGADIKLSDLANSPFATTGYYSVTFTDYVLKVISSISPAYEQTIDELMFSQGADTVSVLMKCSWLPKFPFVYARNYFNNVTDPTNGPLNKTKKSLRQQIKE